MVSNGKESEKNLQVLILEILDGKEVKTKKISGVALDAFDHVFYKYTYNHSIQMRTY